MKRTSNFQPSRLLVDLGKDRQLLVAIAQEVAIQRGRAVAESLFHIAAVRSLQTSPELGARALLRKAKSNFPEEARVLETYAQSFRVANAARFVLAHLPEIHQRYSFLAGER